MLPTRSADISAILLCPQSEVIKQVLGEVVGVVIHYCMELWIDQQKIGHVVAASVQGFVDIEHGSQVIGNIISNGFTVEPFTNVDLFDVGVAFGEGFITSGTNVARKIVAKGAISLAGEIAQNTLDVQVEGDKVQSPVVNSFGEIITDTAVGLTSEAVFVYL